MPENESVVMEASVVRHPAVNTAGEIGEDSPCVDCGYNLRGLKMEGNCPECGTAIGESLPPDMLRYGADRWLRFVNAGVGVVMLSTALILMDNVIGIFHVALVGETPEESIWQAMGMLGLQVFGCYLLTVREAHSLESLSCRRLRWIARIGVAVYSGNAICARLMDWWMDVGTTFVISYVVEAFVLVAVVAQYLYLRILLLRIPRPRLARSLIIVIVAHCVVRLAGFSRIGLFFALKIGGDSEQNLRDVVLPMLEVYRFAEFWTGIAWVPAAIVYLWILFRFTMYLEGILKARKVAKKKLSSS